MADGRFNLGVLNEGSEADKYFKTLEKLKFAQQPQDVAVQADSGLGGEQDTANQTSLNKPKGMDATTAKAGIDALSGVMNAYMQSQFLAKEGQREAQGKAEGVKARGKAQAEMGTAAQTAGGLSDLMALYRNQYARRLT